MKKLFRCPACKKTVEREVARNVITLRSQCGSKFKFVVMRRIKP